ncbi:hypothetical protein [Micromonospora sp. NPDC093277]|uniref:hypothetical protein n=1 Tax=Micromonospora sp. NPDC093277 TaxID=3364291 RepID=UPI00381F3794
MTILVAAVLVVGLLGAVNFLLTFGVLKRLREHTALLSNEAGLSAELGIADPVGDFAAVDTDGVPVRRELLRGETFVAFVSTSCDSCREKLPELVEHARRVPGGREQVLAVVAAGANDADGFAERLAAVARVVVEPKGGPLSNAFRAFTYPTMMWVGPDDAGRVVRIKQTAPTPA